MVWAEEGTGGERMAWAGEETQREKNFWKRRIRSGRISEMTVAAAAVAAAALLRRRTRRSWLVRNPLERKRAMGSFGSDCSGGAVFLWRMALRFPRRLITLILFFILFFLIIVV